MFKVGDIIKGRAVGKYSITNVGMTKAIVVETCIGHNDMKVKILEHKERNNIGSKYPVENSDKYFELVESSNEGSDVAEKVETESNTKDVKEVETSSITITNMLNNLLNHLGVNEVILDNIKIIRTQEEDKNE